MDTMQLQRLFNAVQREHQDDIDKAYAAVSESAIQRRNAWNWQHAQCVVLALMYSKVEGGRSYE